LASALKAQSGSPPSSFLFSFTLALRDPRVEFESTSPVAAPSFPT
jgi:hypothetical protein